MNFQSDRIGLPPRERGDYGFARVRDIAFDAIQELWRRRRAQGMKQTNIVKAIGRQPAWVSRNLRAPGNWTLRTIGELAEALNGEVEIVIHAMEDPIPSPRNYSAYAEYGPLPQHLPSALHDGGQMVSKPEALGLEHAGQVAN